jgi:protein involved in polysaccharide export with SLBB domain
LQREISHGIAITRRLRALVLIAVAILGGTPLLGAQARPRAANEIQVGDRILLRVTGETQLTDTFTVTSGPAVVLPFVGSVPLAGVLRDSVERVLVAAISRFYRDPAVHARTLVRVAVLGEVQRPGFYAVPVDMLLPDVIMTAGGPTGYAQVDRVRILRHGVESLPQDSVMKALAQGMTLSQIDVRSEDQLIVPRIADPERTLRIVGALVTIPVAIITVLLIFKK